MGKASGKKRERRAQRRPSATPTVGVDDQRALGEQALRRLLQSNAPGEFSLAGAYAFGYGELGMAQLNEDGPAWYNECDPLDTLFLGTIWPQRFPDEFTFANARDAWLRLLQGTSHGKAIGRFVHEVVAMSRMLELPVEHGQLLLALTGRLEAAGLDRRRLPRRLLPSTALQDHRSVFGPSPNLLFPEPPADAKKRVRRFWKMSEEEAWAGDTPETVLRIGLHRFHDANWPVKESVVLLGALYSALMAKPGELLDDAGEHAWAWARSVAERSPLVPVLDILCVAPQREMSVEDTLGCLFATPAFTEPIPSEALLWTSSPSLALPRLAFELGIPEIFMAGRIIAPDELDWIGMQTRMRLSAATREYTTDFDDTDDGPEEADGAWDERREAIRKAIREKVGRKDDRPTARSLASDRPVERIWNADGSSAIRFSPDSPQWKTFKKAMKHERKVFREKFGRDPGPDDPLWFDHDADEPIPLTREYFDTMLLEMADHAVDMNIDPAFFHAWREVGYLVTEANMGSFTMAEVIAFRQAVVRNRRTCV